MSSASPMKTCPNCGAKATEHAPRCLVCGAEFEPKEGAKSAKETPEKPTQKPSPTAKDKPQAKPERKVEARKPVPRPRRDGQIALSVPVFLGLFLLFAVLGSGLTYLGMTMSGDGGEVAEATSTATPAAPTMTREPTSSEPTPTATLISTPTPFTYVVQSGDTCGLISGLFDVSIISIVLANNLTSDCALAPGNSLQIPQPTFTATPEIQPTVDPAVLAEEENCPVDVHTVVEGETLSLIAFTNGDMSMTALMEWNGLTSANVFVGQRIEIPECLRTVVWLEGGGSITVTPTAAPLYQPPTLLLPVNGDAFIGVETVTLQWESVGTLRENEYYRVRITDITTGSEVVLVQELKDSKLDLPESVKPADGKPHIFMWTVEVVTLIGEENGEPVYYLGSEEGAPSYFTWAVGG